MGVFALQIKATLENVEELRIPEDHDWCIDLAKQADTREGVLINKEDTAEIEGSRGVANLVLPKMGKNVSISIKDKADKEVSADDVAGVYTADDSDKWKTMMVMEARNVDISKWQLTGPYQVTSTESEDGNVESWKDCSLDEDWYVATAAGASVSITEVESRVIVYKK